MSSFNDEIEIPPQWRSFDAADLDGTVLVIGGSDTGKTTLVRYLVREQSAAGRKVGWLDADPGQSTLGLPATLNLALVDPSSDESSDEPKVAATFFVGSTSPRGHMLPILTGLHRLQRIALQGGCRTLVVDTSGLIDPDAGGGALKEWKIELLRPRAVFGVRRDGELDHLLGPLRRERRLRLSELDVASSVRARPPEERRARRQVRFRRYFERARPLRFSSGAFPVYGQERVRSGQLLAFIDMEGLTLSLGVVTFFRDGDFEVSTPEVDLDRIAAVRIGSLAIDPETGEEL